MKYVLQITIDSDLAQCLQWLQDVHRLVHKTYKPYELQIAQKNNTATGGEVKAPGC